MSERVIYSICLDFNGNKSNGIISTERRKGKQPNMRHKNSWFLYICITFAPYTKRSTRPYSAKKLCPMRDYYLEREVYCSKKRDQNTKQNKLKPNKLCFCFVVFVAISQFLHTHTIIYNLFNININIYYIDMVNTNENKT